MNQTRAKAVIRNPSQITAHNLEPLCNPCELCASVVSLLRETLTTETQSTPRMHRERQY